MRGRSLVLLTVAAMLLATQGSVANPGGEGNDNRDFTCGGSCHGDPALSGVSSAVISIDSSATAFAGTAYQFDTTIEIHEISHSRLLGVFLLGSTDGNGDQPSDYGWTIIQDPSGGTANYVEVTVPNSGIVSLSWVLNAPSNTGDVELIVAVHHGAGYPGDVAYLGVSSTQSIEVNPVPANMPGFAADWTAPNYRVTGDTSPVSIHTQNVTDLSVEWKLEGESLSHLAMVDEGGEDEWLVHLPATMGEGRMVYRVTTSNGQFDVVQPWLTMGTAPPEFDGTVWGARAQGLAGAFMIIALMVTLQGMLQPARRKDDLDQTAEVEAADESSAEPVADEAMPESAMPESAMPEPASVEAEAAAEEYAQEPAQEPAEVPAEVPSADSERYTKYEEYPHLLWDNETEQWVDDPHAGGDE